MFSSKRMKTAVIVAACFLLVFCTAVVPYTVVQKQLLAGQSVSDQSPKQDLDFYGDNVTDTVAPYNTWEQFPIVEQSTLDSGKAGGIGGQRILCVTADPSSNTFYFGTDVAGMYKSTDGGQNWEYACLGINACGVTGIAVDPANSDHVVCIGVGAGEYAWHGVYVSYDGAKSWAQKKSVQVPGHRDFRVQVAFDPSSANADGCQTIYWSSANTVSVKFPLIDDKSKHYGGWGTVPSALYKSTDGGETWSVVNSAYGDCEVACGPDGSVYVANCYGVYRSTDGGNNFTALIENKNDLVFNNKADSYKLTNAGVTSFTSATVNGTFYLYTIYNDQLIRMTADGSRTVLVSSLTSATQSAFGVNTSSKRVYNTALRVNPLDANNIVFARYLFIDTWNATQKAFSLGGACDNGGTQFVTTDGGATWSECLRDGQTTATGLTLGSRHMEGSIIPTTVQYYFSAFSHVENGTNISVGGDYIVRTTDGGQNYEWSNSGNNGGAVTGVYQNINRPELMIATNQDYLGHYSIDGGKSWRYLNGLGSNWGGMTYGGYIFSEKVMALAFSTDTVKPIAITTDGAKKKAWAGYGGGATADTSWGPLTDKQGNQLFGYALKIENGSKVANEGTVTVDEQVMTSYKLAGARQSGMGVLGDDKVFFVDNIRVYFDEADQKWYGEDMHRYGNVSIKTVDGTRYAVSTDAAEIPMDANDFGCAGVYDYDPITGKLYGIGSDLHTIVTSVDQGVSWQTYGVATTPVITNIACNYDNQTKEVTNVIAVYGEQTINNAYGWYTMMGENGIVSQSNVFKLKEPIVNAKGNTITRFTGNGNCINGTNTQMMLRDATVDKKRGIIYITLGRNYMANDVSLLASSDGGQTWTVLSRFSNDGKDAVNTGINECFHSCVNIATGEIMVVSSCRGIWEMQYDPETFVQQVK